MTTELLPIGEEELIGLLREGLDEGADRVHFRTGCAPLGTGHGTSRRLGLRQLAAHDLMSIAEILLRRSYVPERLEEDRCDAAHELMLLCELREEALLVPYLGRDEGGLFIVVELARPLREAPALDLA
jgi:hypothetical protein